MVIPRGKFTAASHTFYRLSFRGKKNSPPTTESSAQTIILLSSLSPLLPLQEAYEKPITLTPHAVRRQTRLPRPTLTADNPSSGDAHRGNRYVHRPSLVGDALEGDAALVFRQFQIVKSKNHRKNAFAFAQYSYSSTITITVLPVFAYGKKKTFFGVPKKSISTRANTFPTLKIAI